MNAYMYAMVWYIFPRRILWDIMALHMFFMINNVNTFLNVQINDYILILTL